MNTIRGQETPPSCHFGGWDGGKGRGMKEGKEGSREGRILKIHYGIWVGGFM